MQHIIFRSDEFKMLDHRTLTEKALEMLPHTTERALQKALSASKMAIVESSNKSLPDKASLAEKELIRLKTFGIT